jgi:hypothetical protein
VHAHTLGGKKGHFWRRRGKASSTPPSPSGATSRRGASPPSSPSRHRLPNHIYMHDAFPEGHENGSDLLLLLLLFFGFFLSVVYDNDTKPASPAMIISPRVFSLPRRTQRRYHPTNATYYHNALLVNDDFDLRRCCPHLHRLSSFLMFLLLS